MICQRIGVHFLAVDGEPSEVSRAENGEGGLRHIELQLGDGYTIGTCVRRWIANFVCKGHTEKYRIHRRKGIGNGVNRIMGNCFRTRCNVQRCPIRAIVTDFHFHAAGQRRRKGVSIIVDDHFTKILRSIIAESQAARCVAILRKFIVAPLGRIGTTVIVRIRRIGAIADGFQGIALRAFRDVLRKSCGIARNVSADGNGSRCHADGGGHIQLLAKDGACAFNGLSPWSCREISRDWLPGNGEFSVQDGSVGQHAGAGRRQGHRSVHLHGGRVVEQRRHSLEHGDGHRYGGRSPLQRTRDEEGARRLDQARIVVVPIDFQQSCGAIAVGRRYLRRKLWRATQLDIVIPGDLVADNTFFSAAAVIRCDCFHGYIAA